MQIELIESGYYSKEISQVEKKQKGGRERKRKGAIQLKTN